MIRLCTVKKWLRWWLTSRPHASCFRTSHWRKELAYTSFGISCLILSSCQNSLQSSFWDDCSWDKNVIYFIVIYGYLDFQGRYWQGRAQSVELHVVYDRVLSCWNIRPGYPKKKEDTMGREYRLRAVSVSCMTIRGCLLLSEISHYTFIPVYRVVWRASNT